MRSFRQYVKLLNESVADIPSDLRSLIDKHMGMNKFTKELYDNSHKDLNELQMSDGVIKSGKRVTTSDIDNLGKNDVYLIVDLGGEGILVGGMGFYNRVWKDKKPHTDVYSNGRWFGVDSNRNIASLLNTDQFKDSKYWLIDLSKAKSTEDLRKERQEAQEGIIQRYNGGWYTTDKSGYRVDRDKYERMLQELKMKGNDYVNDLSAISKRFFDAMSKIDIEDNSWKIRDALKIITDATADSVSKYNDATKVKEKIRKADAAVREIEALANK